MKAYRYDQFSFFPELSQQQYLRSAQKCGLGAKSSE